MDETFLDALEGIEPSVSRILSIHSKVAEKSELINYFGTNFDIMKRLGHGEFAEAFQVVCVQDDLNYAVKKARHQFSGYKNA